MSHKAMTIDTVQKTLGLFDRMELRSGIREASGHDKLFASGVRGRLKQRSVHWTVKRGTGGA